MAAANEMNSKQTFGQLLRYHRRQSHDSLRGGLLTQERLGELLGHELGHAGYSGAAVSDWERGKSKIDEEEWSVLLALVAVLHRSGGLETPVEADELLQAGNYRPLNQEERVAIFGEDPAPPAAPATTAPVAKQPGDAHHNSAAGEDHHKLRILRDKVQRFWIDGVLERMLEQPIAVELTWQPVYEAVDHPWGDLLDPTLYAHSAPSGREPIINVFAGMDRALLILGGPGAGKTTTLLSLARDCCRRAASDPSAPVPVILNLAPWANRQAPLADWLVDELTAKYQIPPRLGSRWLDNDRLILLLDGFDEVPASERRACAQAINRFREEHGLTGLVICSRTAEYEATATRLKLGGAVLLQPLTPAQIDRYVAAAGPPLAGLHVALAHNPALLEMAKTPLMLTIMGHAYSGFTEEQVAALAQVAEAESTAGTYDRLFGAYVQRMFRRHSPRLHLDVRRMEQTLSHLAQKMTEHNQAVFLVEEIQPSWLPSGPWRRAYLLVSGLTAGLYGGLVMWILWLLLRQMLPRLPAVVSAAVGQTLRVGPGTAQFFSLILGNLALGLLFGLIHILDFERLAGPAPTARARNNHLRRRAVVVCLAVGVLTTAVVARFGSLPLALSWSLAEAVMYATASRYLYGVSYGTEIRTYETLGWSWSQAFGGALIGLLLAAAAELLETLLFGYNGVLRTFLTLGLATFLLGGLTGNRIETKNRPNQGIHLSARNALLAALLVALPLGGLTWLLRGGAPAVLTALLAGMVVFALFGGSSVGKHYFVRLLLAYRKTIPFRLSAVLDNACRLVLVRRVGGGFMFLHRLLQTYFARTAS